MMTHVHQEGQLSLTFSRVGDHSALSARRQRFPLRTTVATYPDDRLPGMPWLIVQNPTGGAFPDDQLSLDVRVESHAQAHVRNQSATKVYAGEGGASVQKIDFDVGSRGILEYFGDTFIPHAGSRFEQVLNVHLASDAIALFGETLAAGRVARGERFAFTSARFSTRGYVDGTLAFHDRMDLEPDRWFPGSRGAFGDRNYLTSIVAACPGFDTERLAAVADTALASCAIGAAGVSTLPSGVGVIIRILSASAGDVRRNVRVAWDALRIELLGARLPERLY